MSAPERAFRWLLRAYPPDFRARYGREMELCFRDQLRDAGRRPLRLWIETVGDVARSALALRMESASGRAFGDTHAGGAMKAMAIVAMVVGVLTGANALVEGWLGGVVQHAGLSFVAAGLGLVAGLVLFVAGLGMLRAASWATIGARVAAFGCLAAFAIIELSAPRLSGFALLLGFGFPPVLLAFLQWGRGTPARGVTA